MANGYFLSRQAEQDIDEIIEHLLQESIIAADTFVEAAYSAFDRISTYPDIGHLREDLTNLPVKFWTVKWHYLVIYKPCDPVEIARVLSGYRDVSELLNTEIIL